MSYKIKWSSLSILTRAAFFFVLFIISTIIRSFSELKYIYLFLQINGWVDFFQLPILWLGGTFSHFNISSMGWIFKQLWYINRAYFCKHVHLLYCQEKIYCNYVITEHDKVQTWSMCVYFANISKLHNRSIFDDTTFCNRLYGKPR